MKKVSTGGIVLLLLLFAACQTETDTIVSSDQLISGVPDTDRLDSLIGEVQSVLIGNLTSAIEKEGFESAALFCSSKAQNLTDSMSEVIGARISRVSAQNRNEKNAPDAYEKEVLLAFQKGKESGNMPLSQINQTQHTYYKPILIGMPVCLKCHGNEEDRDPAAYAVIKEYYPHDKATEYSLGDFRGMWVLDYEGLLD